MSEPLTKDKTEEIDKATSEHLDECVGGKVSVWDECNCEACTVCFEIASRTKEGQESFERDKIIFHHAFAAGWNGKEKNVLSAVRLLREKIEAELTHLRKQIKQYEKSDEYCFCNCNDLRKYADQARERVQALWFVKRTIAEVFGGCDKEESTNYAAPIAPMSGSSPSQEPPKNKGGVEKK